MPLIYACLLFRVSSKGHFYFSSSDTGSRTENETVLLQALELLIHLLRPTHMIKTRYAYEVTATCLYALV